MVSTRYLQEAFRRNSTFAKFSAVMLCAVPSGMLFVEGAMASPECAKEPFLETPRAPHLLLVVSVKGKVCTSLQAAKLQSSEAGRASPHTSTGPDDWGLLRLGRLYCLLG